MTTQPWTRQRDEQGLEPILWFGRFTVYREMGTERTLLGAVNKVNKRKGKQTFIPGSWSEASKKWNWKARAESYDLHEMERRETEYKTACDAWAKDRFHFAVTARVKLDELMSFPVVRQMRVGTEGEIHITEPLSAKQIKDVIQAYKGIDDLARTTTRETLPVTKVAPVTPDGKEEYGKDTDRQRLALIRQLVATEQASDSGPDTQ